ncbi:MAG: 50S ribosomal protein L28 [Patescibacteria group bacterium]|nr:50S ribosomal protein L28 [Patescibacteria group bacterium]
MARKCEICGRGTITGASRSHSNIKTKRTLRLNLQWKNIDGKRTKICAKCIKTMAKIK